jgi:hypothetical protein
MDSLHHPTTRPPEYASTPVAAPLSIIAALSARFSAALRSSKSTGAVSML